MAISKIEPASLQYQAGTGPAFSAYQSSAQTITSNVSTKILFQSKEYDTASCYDTSNSRFTPNVAGYYHINAAFAVSNVGTRLFCGVYKNGATAKRGNNAATQDTAIVSADVYLNGSTDYIEIYGLSGATQACVAALDQTYFQASLVRAT